MTAVLAEEDALWAAVADPTRRRVLDALLEHGEASSTTLAEGLPVTRQAVAKHIVVLTGVGLVAGRRRGRETLYTVRPERLDDAVAALARVAAQWDRRLARIKRIAESVQAESDSDSQKEKENPMPDHKTGTHEEWLSARLELLDAEKELTRRGDELARMRQELPWVPIEKEYLFETDEGSASLADLFQGRSQLLLYHFMFGPDFTAGCPSCSAIADGFSGSVAHLINHDVAFTAVSRAPLAKLQDYKRRMGWSFPWASSFESDFNHDFHVTHTEQEWQSGAVDYNFRTSDFRPSEQSPGLIEIASGAGTDPVTFRKEGPGMSAFVLEDGIVFHTYSAYGRGVDGLWGMYSWLDRAPLGRNESGIWWRRHDEYGEG